MGVVEQDQLQTRWRCKLHDLLQTKFTLSSLCACNSDAHEFSDLLNVWRRVHLRNYLGRLDKVFNVRACGY